MKLRDRDKCAAGVVRNRLDGRLARCVGAARCDVPDLELDPGEAVDVGSILDRVIDDAVDAFVGRADLELPAEEEIDESGGVPDSTRD